MVKGIREKFRSNALKELARERGTKRPRKKESEDSSSDDDEEKAKLNRERMLEQAKSSNNSLLSILPKPKNSSAFGPTVKIGKLLKMPERADQVSHTDHNQKQAAALESACTRIDEHGMVEIDVRNVVSDDIGQSYIKELTVEKSKSTVIIPKGKEKQKNQITYLAQLGKATELERKEQAAQGRMNKAAARSKYGW